MCRRAFRCAALSAVAVGLVFAGSVSAASIGVQFSGATGNSPATPVGLSPSQVAGVVPQADFNVATGGAGGASSLLDSTGATTNAAVTFTGNGGYTASPNQPVSPDEILNQGIINGTSGTTPTVTVTGIPASYTSYDLIVYTLDDAARDERITVGTTSFTVSSPGGASTNYQDSNAATPYTYIQGTTNSTTPVAGSDYVRFTGLTGSSLTFSADGRAATFSTNTNDNAFVNGFQIVQTPEPASIGLLALGGFGLLVRRRRV